MHRLKQNKTYKRGFLYVYGKRWVKIIIMKSHARNQEKLINPVLVDAIHDNIFLIINLETFELRSCLSPFQTVVAIVICRQAIPDALYRSYSFHVLHVFSQTLYFFYLSCLFIRVILVIFMFIFIHYK